jgi:hypothetical protein
MQAIPGIPFTFAQFDAEGNCIQAPAVPDDTQELIVASHGWNNDRAEAEALYHELFSNFAAVKPAGVGKIAVIGVIWPSKKFDLGADDAPAQGAADLVNAASVGGANRGARDAAIAHAFDAFEKNFADSGKDAQLADLRALGTRLGQPGARARFVEQLRQLVGTPAAASALDGSDVFFGADPDDVFANAAQASSEVGTAPTGEAGSGGAASLAGLADGVANAVSNLLNLTTYYEMKKRAGSVGTRGLAPMIDQFAGREGLRRIHLVGHSFGGRLVTAAAMASTTAKLHSMSLLQAAFSHNGFSKSQRGYFRKAVSPTRFTGPVIITHTANDLAVGKAYAIASRISRDMSSGAGDADDKYGGLGRNGALHMDAGEVSDTVTAMLAAGEAYALRKQVIHNLESSPYIKSHGDVRGPAVAWAISQAIGTV